MMWGEYRKQGGSSMGGCRGIRRSKHFGAWGRVRAAALRLAAPIVLRWTNIEQT